MKFATYVVPFRGESAAIYKGWLYPFRSYLTAEEFVRDCYAGLWSDEELQKFERYAA